MAPALPADPCRWHAPWGDGRRLQLWPQRAAFDPALGLLLLADVHLGKATAFRRLGVPVPGGTTAQMLARLDGLLAATGAGHIAFLGDLLHSAAVQGSPALQALARWRDRHPQLRLTLIRGNHDAQAGDPPAELGIGLADEPWPIGPWQLRHHPLAATALAPGRPGPDEPYTLAGHVHPGVALAGRGGDRLRLPCFHFGPRQGLLPAFGSFTGLHLLRGGPGVAVYPVLADGAGAGTGGGDAPGAPAGTDGTDGTVPGLLSGRGPGLVVGPLRRP